MKGLAFALDPDGYWVEIVKREGGDMAGKGPHLSQTMLRYDFNGLVLGSTADEEVVQDQRSQSEHSFLH